MNNPGSGSGEHTSVGTVCARSQAERCHSQIVLAALHVGEDIGPETDRERTLNRTKQDAVAYERRHLLPAQRPFEQLLGLVGPEDDAGQRGAEQPVADRERGGAEGVVQEGKLHHRDLEHD
jgi:hypothetical protein